MVGRSPARSGRRFVGAVLQRVPVKGRGAFARWLQRHPGSDEIAYRDKLGLRRTVDLRIDLESLWFVGIGGLPDSLVASIQPGSWVVDVGANTGIMTGQLCQAVGTEGRVWAFEPLDLNLRRLKALQQQNRLPQLRIFDCALGATDGTATLRTGGPTSGAFASFTASWIRDATVEVQVRRLDTLVASSPVDRPLSLLKVDVEGAEFDVLDGAMETLQRHRPAVFCEFHDWLLREGGSSAAALLDKFRSMGYEPAPEYRTTAGHLDESITDLLMLNTQ